jgi:hypothetical protein
MSIACRKAAGGGHELALGEPLATAKAMESNEVVPCAGTGVLGEDGVGVGIGAGVEGHQPGVFDAEFLDGAAGAGVRSFAPGRCVKAQRPP